jgi:hypothetical protein
MWVQREDKGRKYKDFGQKIRMEMWFIGLIITIRHKDYNP